MSNNRNGSTDPASRPSSGQIEVVTILRGFAATSVFLFHLVCLSKGYISGKFLFSIFQFGKYGVQFFFVISGFVIPYSMIKAGYQTEDFFKFLKKRIIRIEPPYLVVLFLTVCFLLVRSHLNAGNGPVEMPGWQQVALHIGYLIPFSNYSWLSIVFWTLAIEFQFYLVFSLAYPMFVRGNWQRWVIYILMITACFISRSSGGLFFYWAPVFLMGIHTALHKMKKISTVEFWLVIPVLAVIVLYKLGWETAVFALAALLAIYFELNIRSRLLHFLGNISYSLYLSHTLVAFAIINVGIRFTKNIYQKAFFVTLAIAATLAFSYLLYSLVERPAKKWAAAIKYR